MSDEIVRVMGATLAPASRQWNTQARQRLEPKVKAMARRRAHGQASRFDYLRSVGGRKEASRGAARVLGVSVPAVAKMITALEKYLGIKIFDRTRKGPYADGRWCKLLEAVVRRWPSSTTPTSRLEHFQCA